MTEAPVKPKRNRTTARGNLLKLLAVLVVFTGFAVTARLVNREPTLILPELLDREQDAALRASPDNALYGLREADAQLPDPPEPVAALLNEWSGRLWEHGWPRFSPEINRFIHFDDPALNEYLVLCSTALDATHNALDSPYFLQIEPDTYLTDFSETFSRLAIILVVRGAYAGRVQGDAAEAVLRLTDAIRLSRFLVSDEAGNTGARGIEDEAYRQFILSLEAIRDPADLSTIQTALQDLGPAWPNPNQALEKYWRKIDNTLSFMPRQNSDIGGRPFRRLFFLREVQYWAMKVIQHKEFFAQLADAPLAAHRRMYDEYGQIDSDWRSRQWQQLHRNSQLLHKAAYTNLHHQRALVALALERHRVAEGNYPDSLQKLVPALLVALPEDQVSGGPLAYRREGERYALYSVGIDGLDDGGSDEDDLWLIKP